MIVSKRVRISSSGIDIISAMQDVIPQIVDIRNSSKIKMFRNKI